MGVEMEIVDLCYDEDEQTIKFGDQIEDFGSSKSARDPYCSITEISLDDCIQKIGPIYDTGGLTITDMQYETKTGKQGTLRGSTKFNGGQLYNFGEGNCLVGVSAEYKNQKITRVKFHYTEGYIPSSECDIDYDDGVGTGGAIAFVLVSFVAVFLFFAFGTYCCGWKIPVYLRESCWYKNGFCYCCEWGQHDRSKKYEEDDA